MDSYAFLCPNCREELKPEQAGANTAVCPRCRRLFVLMTAKEPDAGHSFMAGVGKVILYLLATIGLIVGVVFAGCLLQLR